MISISLLLFPGYFQLHDGNEEIRLESRLNKRSNSLTFYNLPALSVGRCGTLSVLKLLSKVEYLDIKIPSPAISFIFHFVFQIILNDF